MSNKKKKKNSNYKGYKAPVAAKKKKTNTHAIVGIVCLVVILLSVALSITFCSMSKRNRYVKMTVEGHGEIILELNAKVAPKTVKNFIGLVNEGFYDGLTFHRIIEDFMIQGGDPKANGTGGNTDKNGKEINVVGEFSENGHNNKISHKRGVISMARSDDPDSASSQFFICNADATHLDGSYAAFGHVLYGMEVVDSITEEGVKYVTDKNGSVTDKTKQPKITSIVEISKKEAMSYTK